MKYIDAENTSNEIATPQADKQKNLTFEEYLRGVFEINNGIENDPDNLVRIHAPELLKLARKQEQPDVQNGKFVFPKYLYARTKDNKTIDMSYAPQDMTAVEYIRNDFVQQKQPEGDLDEEITKWIEAGDITDTRFDDYDDSDIERTARHFYELGLNARKEETK